MEDFKSVLLGIEKKLQLLESESRTQDEKLAEYQDIVPRLYQLLVDKSKLIKDYEEHKKVCTCTQFRGESLEGSKQEEV